MSTFEEMMIPKHTFSNEVNKLAGEIYEKYDITNLKCTKYGEASKDIFIMFSRILQVHEPIEDEQIKFKWKTFSLEVDSDLELIDDAWNIYFHPENYGPLKSSLAEFVALYSEGKIAPSKNLLMYLTAEICSLFSDEEEKVRFMEGVLERVNI